MNFNNNASSSFHINYRILKSPIEVIKPNEHHMTLLDYRAVLRQLSINLESILNYINNTKKPENLEIFGGRYPRYYSYYIDYDFKIFETLIKSYSTTANKITDAFRNGKIVCYYEYDRT